MHRTFNFVAGPAGPKSGEDLASESTTRQPGNELYTMNTALDQHQKAFAILMLGWLPSPAPKPM
jgi:hypothetical protein